MLHLTEEAIKKAFQEAYESTGQDYVDWKVFIKLLKGEKEDESIPGYLD